jgi:hypothetical protein
MGFHDASGIQTPTPRCIWQEQMAISPVLSKHFTDGVEVKILLFQDPDILEKTYVSYASETRITFKIKDCVPFI